MQKINKKYLLLLFLTLLVTLLLPVILIYTIAGYTGLALMVICLVIINPAYFIIIGYISGKELKKYWSLPLLAVIITMVSLRLLLMVSFKDLLFYLVVYLLCALIAMIISRYIKTNRDKGEPQKNKHIMAIIIVILVIVLLICSGVLVFR